MKIDLLKVLQRLMAIYNVYVNMYEYPYDIERIDLGLRKILNPEFQWSKVVRRFSMGFSENILYIMEDVFGAYYAMFLLPGDFPRAIVIGPYRLMGTSFRKKDYEEKGFSDKEIDLIKDYIINMPHIHEDVITLQVAAILAEAVENGEFKIEHIREAAAAEVIGKNFYHAAPFQNEKLSMDIIAYRYNIENEVLEAISLGNAAKAKKVFEKMMKLDIVQRYEPSVQSRKNSLIILNTLFRKAIEKSHVSPYYIDEISYRFFQKIDFVSGEKEQMKLLDTMINEYCEYVRKYSVEQFSPTVQNVINYIYLNMINPITLKDIAETFGLNSSYLSRLFRTETGKTVVEYINSLRIQHAAAKLKQSSYSISEISESVGIMDTNYFSRLFRKYMGCSPTDYRK